MARKIGNSDNENICRDASSFVYTIPYTNTFSFMPINQHLSISTQVGSQQHDHQTASSQAYIITIVWVCLSNSYKSLRAKRGSWLGRP